MSDPELIMRKNKMILAIDASNISAGGGVTHLVELLGAANPEKHGFLKVIVFSSYSTLNQIEDRSWLIKSLQPLLEKSLLYRVYWQRFKLSKLAIKNECSILFVPGGSFANNFRPIVTMSQNLLPFEWKELRRYGWTWTTLRLILLRISQKCSFKKANGVIFLSKYAENRVSEITGQTLKRTAVIPHGLNLRFQKPPKRQYLITEYSTENPFKILYVSSFVNYKHHWHVVEAVSVLRQEGYPVILNLIGPAHPTALIKLKKMMKRIDPEDKWIHYLGTIPYTELHHKYFKADLGIFASSCENMPITLLEKMSSGLPIACSNRGPMPEVLRNAGSYFDPEKPEEIVTALRKLIVSPELREKKANKSYLLAQKYLWERCADETFKFLATVALNQHKITQES